jgi:hypothetical protein
MVAVAVRFPPHGEIVSNRCSGCTLLALTAKGGHDHQFIAAIAHDLAGGELGRIATNPYESPVKRRWFVGSGILAARAGWLRYGEEEADHLSPQISERTRNKART